MTDVPLVSIGLPTRNRAESLRRAVQSVLTQDWANLELVICDNASTDETERLCRHVLDEDERVRYVRQPENIGAQANFRDALQRSRGKLFMWLADDDWLDPTYVSECAGILLANPDHVLVCGRAKYFRAGELAFTATDVNLLGSSAAARVARFYRTVTTNGTFYGLMRREQLAQLPMPTGLGGDWLLVASLAYLGKVRTLGTIAINRSVEGVSKDAAGLGRSYGLSRSQAANWHLLLARAAYADVLRSPVYRSLGRAQRMTLGATAAVLVALRFSWKVWLGWLLTRLGLFERARRRLESRRRRPRP